MSCLFMLQVLKTQTSLTKLKETTVSDEVSRRAEYDYVSSDEENIKQLKAPTESLKTWIDFNEENDSRTLEELTSPQETREKPKRPPPPPPPSGKKKAPPSRPPRPASQTGGPPPPRPPPPSAKKSPSPKQPASPPEINGLLANHDLDFSFLENKFDEQKIEETVKPQAPLELDFSQFEAPIVPCGDFGEYSLDDDFGFDQKQTTRVIVNPCDTLLFEEDGQPIDDPFDTSHVDIIAQATAVTPIDEGGHDPFDTSFVDTVNHCESIATSFPHPPFNNIIRCTYTIVQIN